MIQRREFVAGVLTTCAMPKSGIDLADNCASEKSLQITALTETCLIEMCLLLGLQQQMNNEWDEKNRNQK